LFYLDNETEKTPILVPSEVNLASETSLNISLQTLIISPCFLHFKISISLFIEAWDFVLIFHHLSFKISPNSHPFPSSPPYFNRSLTIHGNCSKNKEICPWSPFFPSWASLLNFLHRKSIQFSYLCNIWGQLRPLEHARYVLKDFRHLRLSVFLQTHLIIWVTEFLI